MATINAMTAANNTGAPITMTAELVDICDWTWAGKSDLATGPQLGHSKPPPSPFPSAHGQAQSAWPLRRRPCAEPFHHISDIDNPPSSALNTLAFQASPGGGDQRLVFRGLGPDGEYTLVEFSGVVVTAELVGGFSRPRKARAYGSASAPVEQTRVDDFATCREHTLVIVLFA